ncbi:NUDIX domain-containing protein [Roseivirga sp.]|uniref:NUDIX domain-containing protein n=1 Tax=Roseivirga sp. TaxID=1964215 RepID=UPI003B8D6D4D
MTDLDDKISKIYGEKLRIRVSGVCIKDEKILLVHHKSLGETGSLWAPPGGGMEYGESAEEALKREYKEETGLSIEVDRFLFVHEYLAPPLHGIELFFLVRSNNDTIIIGEDPEMDKNNQIITSVGFHDLKALQSQKMKSLHYVLQHVDSVERLINLKGYFKFH